MSDIKQSIDRNIENNAKYIEEYSSKWNKLYEQYPNIEYIELTSTGVYLEMAHCSTFIIDKTQDEYEEIFRYFVSKLDLGANVGHYLMRKNYNLVTY